MNKWIQERKIKFLNNIWIKGLIQEKEEYSQAIKILEKYSKTKKLTKEESALLHTQLWDTLKLTGMGIIFILPVGSMLLVGLVFLSKKTGLDILPSAFKNIKK